MKSRVGLLLIALVAALAVYVPVGTMTAHNVHADAGCQLGDQEGIVYQDGYWNAWWSVLDLYAHVWRNVGTDIIAYRATHNGACHRGYYSSVWMQDGAGCYCHAHIRVWIGGVLSQEFDSAPIGWNNFARLSSYHWQAADWTTWVDIPHGGGLVDFANYHDGGWGPQADNLGSEARIDYTYSPPLPDWDTWPYACPAPCGQQSQNWYLHF